VVVDPKEPGCGVSNDPKKANGFSGRVVEFEDGELGDVFVPVVEVADEPGDVTELSEVLSVVAGPEFGDDACEPDDSLSSAVAIPAVVASAAPIPSATANAPTLPIAGTVVRGLRCPWWLTGFGRSFSSRRLWSCPV
jgi:hypothetical protein